MNIDRRTSSKNSFTSVNLSDDTDIQLIDLSALYDEEKALYYPRGFQSAVDGTLSVLPAGNATSHTVNLKVNAGVDYHYSIRRFRSTGTTGISNGDIVAWR